MLGSGEQFLKRGGIENADSDCIEFGREPVIEDNVPELETWDAPLRTIFQDRDSVPLTGSSVVGVK